MLRRAKASERDLLKVRRADAGLVPKRAAIGGGVTEGYTEHHSLAASVKLIGGPGVENAHVKEREVPRIELGEPRRRRGQHCVAAAKATCAV